MGRMTDVVIGRAFLVDGVVQGVGFRWFTREIAVRTATTGWVANRSDGSVHGEVFGIETAVAEFLAAVGRGPTLGRVEKFEVTEIDVRANSRFEILK